MNNEITLNERIAAAFERYGPSFREQWCAISPIEQSRTLREDLLAVNRFLRIQLGLLDTDTTIERQLLSNDVDLNEWLDGFEDIVLPTIIAYGLPACFADTEHKG